jgi:alpha-methylacyl-CoA racemase
VVGAGLLATGQAPRPGGELLTGGSPRYQVYRTADRRFLAAAPLEQRFWDIFCDLIELPAERRDDARDPEATRDAVARIIASGTAAHWQGRFAGHDCCCNLVVSLEEAVADLHFRGRGLFEAQVEQGGERLPALPVPLAPALRPAPDLRAAPQLGEASDLLDGDGAGRRSRL